MRFMAEILMGYRIYFFLFLALPFTLPKSIQK